MIKQAIHFIANKETERLCNYYIVMLYLKLAGTKCILLYDKTFVEFDLVQHQISFAGLRQI